MTTTAAQGLQHTLSNTEMRTVLFAVQMEATRYKDIPTEDLPIEILTLLRAKDRLANIVHGLDNKPLLMHEWEIFLSAMKLEAVRYEMLHGMEKPKYVQTLLSAIQIVRGVLMADHMSIQEAGKTT